jgi:hypothetical protein
MQFPLPVAPPPLRRPFLESGLVLCGQQTLNYCSSLGTLLGFPSSPAFRFVNDPIEPSGNTIVAQF